MLFLGAEVCGNLQVASQREWLLTNGLGGFCSATISGLHTRRYHGLLCAAIKPPSERFLLLSKLEDTLVIDGARHDLSVNTYPGVIHPEGYRFQNSFRLEPFPVYTWRVQDIEISKSVFMVHESNTVVVQYFLRAQGDASRRDVKLEVRPLVAYRGYHELAHHNDAFRTAYDTTDGQVTIAPYDHLPPLHFAHDAVTVEASGNWYFNFEYEEERLRGLDYQEDLFQPFVLHYDLNARAQAAVIASLDRFEIAKVPELRQAESNRLRALGGQLAAAADQFIVKRGERHSIIAGYPWFADWGRDTMISLPGLTLSTARSGLAREILEEFSLWIRDGMLPNWFPNGAEQPEYNTVDAALWYIEAVRACVDVTGDFDWLFGRIYPGLTQIIDAYVRGTHYGIALDSDGLIRAGEPGMALTWMDARPGGIPTTARIGKPVEIQALWYNALRIMEAFATLHDDPRKDQYAAMADAARASFETKFWNAAENCLFDVVDPIDASIRPNQIFALSLSHKIVDTEIALSVLNVVERELLTPFGLRTLSPRDPKYCPFYGGDVLSRDSHYHQGTVWPWLMGHFVIAYFDAHNRDAAARQKCLNWLSALKEYRTQDGMNQLPEVFDGNPPHRPGGCPAQAWSLALMIQAFRAIY